MPFTFIYLKIKKKKNRKGEKGHFNQRHPLSHNLIKLNFPSYRNLESNQIIHLTFKLISCNPTAIKDKNMHRTDKTDF